MSRSMHLRSRGPVQDTTPTVPGHLAESSPLSLIPTNRSSVSDTEEIGQESPIPRLRALSYSEVVAGPARARLQSPRVDSSDHSVDAAQDAIESVSEGPKGNSDPDPAVSKMDKGQSEGRSTPGADTVDAHLTKVQVEAIRAAEDKLSAEQRDVLARRNKALTIKERVPEHESRDKGKGADPANWGEFHSDDEIQDVELQKKVMKSYQDLKRGAHTKDIGGAGPSNSQAAYTGKVPPTEHRTVDITKVYPKIERGPSVDQLRLQSLVDEVERLKGELANKPFLRTKKGKSKKSSKARADSSASEIESVEDRDNDVLPIRQVAENSALGKFFAQVRARSNAPSDPSDSSSDDDSSHHNDSSGSSSSNGGRRNKQRPKGRHSRPSRSHSASRRRAKKRKAVRESKIKPVQPKAYNGEAYLPDFHRFMMEVVAYLEDGQVPRVNEVRTALRFLEGRAHVFASQVILFDIENWTLDRLFTELFNHFFPSDFRERQRMRLNRCYQNDRSVKEYAAELAEIYMAIGTNDKQDKVVRLWQGFRKSLKSKLWENGFTGLRCSWERMVRQAETYEVAASIAGNGERPREKRQSSAKPDGGRNERTNGGFLSRKGHSMPQSNGGSSKGSRRDFKASNGDAKPKSNKFNLSKQEMNDLRAAKKCFLCKEAGHVARQCPRVNSVTSSAGGRRPPGVRSNNVEISFENAEDLRTTIEDDDTLHTIEIGMIDVSSQLAEAVSLTGPVDDRTEDEGMGYDTDPEMPGLIPVDDDNSDDEGESGVPIPEDVGNTFQRYFDDWDDNNGNGSGILASGMESPEAEDGAQIDPQSIYVMNWGLFASEMLAEVRVIDDYVHIPVEQTVTADPFEDVDGELVMTPEVDIKEWANMSPTQWNERTHWEWYSAYYFPGGCMGDSVANAQTMYMETVKELGFPGDDKFAPVNKWEPRFTFWSISSQDYALRDSLRKGEIVLVNKKLLQAEEFNLAWWYAKYLADANGIDHAERCVSLMEWQPFVVDALDENVFAHLGAMEIRAALTEGREAFVKDNGRWWLDFDDAREWCTIGDRLLKVESKIKVSLLENASFNLEDWYEKRIQQSYRDVELAVTGNDGTADLRALYNPDEGREERALDSLALMMTTSSRVRFDDWEDELQVVEMFGQQVPPGTYPAIQRNAAIAKDFVRLIPRPVVVTVNVNGKPARALLDSGSLGDFVSSTLAEQLKLDRVELEKPLPLQLAVQGSRAKINFGCRARIEYQTVKEERYFDIINLSNYDVILGTPWMFQHQVKLGVNPASVVIGSTSPLPLKGDGVSKLASRAMEMHDKTVERAREELLRYAKPLCLTVEDTPLPPLRAINHTIPLIDEGKIYPWRPAKCPEALRAQWVAKRNAYLKSGRWKVTNSGNACPMLLIYKPGTKQLRTVFDLRERNKNTRKMATPMPDIEGILRRVACRRYRSTMDGKDAYEQIRIVPGHVARTTVTTPNGNMVSLVMQQGDCNAPATYQALMNHIFGAHLGQFVDVYLDDIIVYSDTLADHVRHVKQVIDILKREKLYLSEAKLHFLQRELKILGRIVDDDGIRMDPHKVDSVLKWKVPTNRDLLRGFLGAVGYLADDAARIRIPMGVLAALTGDRVAFRWEHTHQRAFDEIKACIAQFSEHRRKPLDYGKDAPPVWIATDGCVSGIAGAVLQGMDWKSARVAAFYSAKLSAPQQNYATHEIEMLAGLETMMRHREILQGVKFKWLTDHRGLIHLLNQKGLTGRQARWMEKMSEFDFEPMYIAGTDNVLSDALSRIYSNDAPGTVRSASEYTSFDDGLLVTKGVGSYSAPVLVADEGRMAGTAPGAANNALGVNVLDVDGDTPKQAKEFARRMAAKPFVLHGPRRSTAHGAHRATSPTAGLSEKKLTIRIPRIDKRGGGGGGNVAKAPTQGSAEFHNKDVSGSKPVPAKQYSSTSQEGGATEDVSLLGVLTSRHDGIDLRRALVGKYHGDSFFRLILENPKHYKNFVVREGLVYMRERGNELLCIPNVVIDGRNIREIVLNEAHSLLAHLGHAKTLAYLRDHVWWREIVKDTQAYCASCTVCLRSKPNNQRPYGLLNPLPMPRKPWEVVGIDFVGPLPESSDRDATFDSITVVIDLMSAMVHLIPSRTNYTAKNVAELMYDRVWKLHGLPSAIVSDRDVLFTSQFWRELHRLLRTKLRMSSAYHPESDGATERANRTVTQMIRQCIEPSQKDWVLRLPAIEFAINSARSESTGYAPFFLNNGRMPRSLLWDSPSKDEFPGVRVFAQRIKHALMSAHDSVLAARVKQTRDANRKRRPAPFKNGDLVYVSTKNITFPKGLARKLLPKFVGPYRITRDFKNNSFEVRLPSELLQRGVHNVFHASLLRMHIANDDRLFPGRSLDQVSNPGIGSKEWAVKEIISHYGAGEGAMFEILWASGDKTWMEYDQIAHLQALERYLEALGVQNIAKLPRGSGTPPEGDPQVFIGGIHTAPIRKVFNRELCSQCRQPLPRRLLGVVPAKRTQHLATSSSFSLPNSPRSHRPQMSAPVGNKLFHHHVLTTSPALDQFVISIPTSNEVITRTAAEIRNYIVIHHQAKSGNIPFAGGLPSDYLQFARAYNQEPNIWAKFAMPNANGSLIVSDRDPRARNFGLEDDSLTQAFSALLPVQHHTNNRNNHTNNHNNHTNNRNNGVEERELFLQLLMSHANSTLSYNKKKARGSHRHNPVATRSRPQGTILRTLVPAAAASVPVVSAAASTAVLGNSVTATIIANTTSGGESPTENSKKKNLRKKRVAGKVTSAVEEGAADEMIVDYCEDLEGGPVASSSKA